MGSTKKRRRFALPKRKHRREEILQNNARVPQFLTGFVTHYRRVTMCCLLHHCHHRHSPRSGDMCKQCFQWEPDTAMLPSRRWLCPHTPYAFIRKGRISGYALAGRGSLHYTVLYPLPASRLANPELFPLQILCFRTPRVLACT